MGNEPQLDIAELVGERMAMKQAVAMALAIANFSAGGVADDLLAMKDSFIGKTQAFGDETGAESSPEMGRMHAAHERTLEQVFGVAYELQVSISKALGRS